MNDESLKGSLAVINTNSRNHFDAYRLINALNLNSVCLVLNRTAGNMKKLLKSASINIPVAFIDGISSKIGIEKSSEHSYIDNPEDIASIVGSIEASLAKVSGDKALVIDSINNLSEYHDKKSVLDLLSFLSDRAGKLDITAFVLNQHAGNASGEFLREASKITKNIITLP